MCTQVYKNDWKKGKTEEQKDVKKQYRLLAINILFTLYIHVKF